jgi:hypothetical protein
MLGKQIIVGIDRVKITYICHEDCCGGVDDVIHRPVGNPKRKV